MWMTLSLQAVTRMVFRNSNNTSSATFRQNYLGKLKYFLGIEVAQSNFKVVISQRKYTLDILTDIGMLDYKPVDTPMDPNVKLVPSQDELLRDLGRYRRLVGKLNYLNITRPDISFPMSVVSQFLQSPCIAIGMLLFVFSIISKEHQVKGCCMRTEVIIRLLAIVMQTGQAHP